MKTKITKIIDRQIIDSRGNPTVEADVYLNEKFLEEQQFPLVLQLVVEKH